MFINHSETLIKIITLSNYVILLEGPTSCGKTNNRIFSKNIKSNNIKNK